MMDDDETVIISAGDVSRESIEQQVAASSSMSDERGDVPHFETLSAMEMAGGDVETRVVPIPRHRFTPLREQWMEIYTPLVQHMKLQVRVVPKARKIEVRTSPQTENAAALRKGEDFLKAFMLGFELRDAVGLLRMDNLYIETFEIKDVRRLQGQNLSRAIGRISGKDGRTKFAIENATRTRIVLADTKIHILGSFQNIQVARRSICDLILGSPPGKVTGRLRVVSSRMKERF